MREAMGSGNICATPLDIQVVTVDGEIPAADTGDVFKTKKAEKGFICLNADQVRHSSSGLAHLRLINLGFLYHFFRQVENVPTIKFGTYARSSMFPHCNHALLINSSNLKVSQVVQLNRNNRLAVVVVLLVVVLALVVAASKSMLTVWPRLTVCAEITACAVKRQTTLNSLLSTTLR